MNGKILLDTNILISFFNGNIEYKNRLEKLRIFVPTIVFGKLYFGAEESKNRLQNLKKIDEFKKYCIVLDVDDYTAKIYGKVKSKLKKRGKPIPENDIWIASIAIENNLLLATQDSHFENVENIKIENW
ncbi:MAG: type II toxin-antitoxin system VapC family toxin [Candidatus Cloacimonetes bacterium]|nr:type II toxin-antitoxin system VapC family toxin [Candidatus Cloacimonadota bacterium]MBL7085919.1 type II toxin-antitoxin system VapC family toxin [Candidatus Cloacimonadota bacterium]